MAEGGRDEKTSGSTPFVFISYASQDAAVANAIVENLEQQGLQCWLAPRDVRPGAQYADAIVGAINEAKAVVLLLSQNAVASSHVGREVERAASKHKPIISFRIDAATLSRALEYFLSESQWIDVSAIGMPAALAKLAETVGQRSGQSVAAQPAVSGRPFLRTGGRSKLIAGAAALIVGIAAVLGVRFWSQNHDTVPARVAGAITDKSIAVLPFVDLSEKHDQEYFADGMAEETLNQLTKIPGLKVIGRTSSFQFKGKAEDLRKLGEALGAAFILEGSVRRAGDRIRVTTQLISAADGAHRWSETYERSVVDVLTIQTEIALSIGRALKLEVAELPRLDSQLSPSRREAYDVYLRGEHALDRGDQRGFEEAVAGFRSALQRDPTFADAAEALSSALENLVEWHFVEPQSGSQQVREAALLALKLNPRSAGAHAVLGGNITVYDWDWVRADQELNVALALSPKEPDVASFAAMHSVAVGKWERALQLLDAAITDDPLNPGLLNPQSMTLARLGRWSEAEEVARRILEISPTSSWNRYWLSVILLMQGKSEEALREAKQETAAVYRLAAIGMACHAVGRHAESDAALHELEASQLLGSPMRIAEVYAVRGDPTKAMDWLEKAYSAKDSSLYYIKGHPPFRSLEGDPRYKAFLRKMNLPE